MRLGSLRSCRFAALDPEHLPDHDTMITLAHKREGITLLEVVLVVALVSLFAAVGVYASRPAPSAIVARELTDVLTSQRWNAVNQGRPVVIHLSDRGNTLVTSLGRFGCVGGPASSVLFNLRPDVRVHWPSMALAFDPQGRARRCDGSGPGNTTIGIVDRRGNQAAVIVAALGRVRWEQR